MKKLILCISVSAFAAVASLQAADDKAPAPKATDQKSAPAPAATVATAPAPAAEPCCDAGCATIAKVLMSPKAAAIAAN